MPDSLDELRELREFRARRDYECRLTPDRALETFADAHDFLRDRGLLTRTPDCALPSLYEACHEDPYQPGGRGFASWPATSGPGPPSCPSLLPDVHSLDIHRGKTIAAERRADGARRPHLPR